jgi:hypothetical protein
MGPWSTGIGRTRADHPCGLGRPTVTLRAMTRISIDLGPGSDGQPNGKISGKVWQSTSFTGWLELIRLLEDELASIEAGAGGTPTADEP